MRSPALGAARERSVDLLDRVIRSSVDGILAFDRECRYTVWNPGMERISGIAAAEVLGQCAFDVFPFLVEIGEDAFFHAALAGETRVARDRPFVVPDTGKQGFFEGHYSPLLDENGAVTGGLGVIRDITERKRAEEAVRESEQRLRLALSAATMGVWSWDVREDRLSWSDEVDRVFGIARESLGADRASYLDLVDEDDLERVSEALRGVLASGGGADFEIEHRIAHGSGGTRWVHLKGRMFRDERGEPVRMVGIALDVSARKRLEEELLHSHKLESLGRLAGGIAHDFNNLLTVIFGTVALARSQVPRGSPCDESLDVVHSTCERAAGLTDQLLAFARRQVVQPRVLDLNALVTEVEKLLRRLLGEDIELRTRLDPDLWRTLCDPGQMEQVLVNLSINAREAMPSGGVLTIETSNVAHDDVEGRGDFVRLVVRDTGEGLSAEARSRAFEPFFTTKERGRGLGLASCYGIVKQAGGNMAVVSEPGRGAQFIVELPRTSQTEAAREIPTDAPRTAGSETVLVVEDEPMVRTLIVREFERHGYTTLAAEDGEAARRLAEAHDGPIHAIVTDAIMPRMGGVELVAHLRAARPGIEPLLMSGYPGERAGDMGGSALPCLKKPFAPVQAVRRVRALLDGRR